MTKNLDESKTTYLKGGDDLDFEKLSQILDEDGVVVASSAKVIRSRSKHSTTINTKNKAKPIENKENQEEGEEINKRAYISNPKASYSKNIKGLKKKFRFTWTRFFRSLLTTSIIAGVILIIVVSVGFAWLIDYYNDSPTISEEELKAGESSIVFLSDGETELYRFFDDTNRRSVELDEIPKEMQWAVIAVEQKDFYRQDLPWSSIARATRDCVFQGFSDCAGASGIAQQLYKNITGDSDVKIDRKIRELFAAKKLVDNNSKDKILSLYLNWVYFGGTTSGVGTASEIYFDKPISEITIPEACLLAAMPKDPVLYELALYAKDNPESPNYIFWTGGTTSTEAEIEGLLPRKDNCIQKLNEYNIKDGEEKLVKTEEEITTLQAVEIVIAPKEENRSKVAPHFVDYVIEELRSIFTPAELNRGGFEVVTTLDKDIQEKTEQIVLSESVKGNIFSVGFNNAAVVVVEGETGHIKAMVGSLDYFNEEIKGQVNMTTAPQQPGSSFKPYVYASAFEKGLNPSTVVIDRKIDFGGGYIPENFSKRNYGPITLAMALQKSLNVPAVMTAYFAAGNGYDINAGPKEVYDFSRKIGVRFPYDDVNVENGADETCIQYVSMSLGNCSVSLVSHATGLNTFAQDGYLKTSTPIKEIRFKQGDLSDEEVQALESSIKERLSQRYPNSEEPVIDTSIARQMNNVLADNDLRKINMPSNTWGFSDSELIIPGWEGNIAAKTGTSTGPDGLARDNLTVGYTKKYTVVAWAGHSDDNAPTAGTPTGLGLVARPIWNPIMRMLHENVDLNENIFSTEGLTETNLNCPRNSYGSTRCSKELLTPKQVEKYENYKTILSSRDFNPLNLDIFTYLGEIISYNANVSILDGKIPSDDYPENYIVQAQCVNYISAFPNVPSWFNSAKASGGSGFSKTDSGYLSYECAKISDIDPNNIQTDITTSPAIRSGNTVPRTSKVGVTSNLETLKVAKIEVYIDGDLVSENTDNDSLEVNFGDLDLEGNKTILIKVFDTNGIAYEKQYTNVKFIPTDEEEEENSGSSSATTSVDLFNSIVNCTANSIVPGDSISCSLQLPAGKTQANSNVTIQFNSGTTRLCTYSSGTYSCPNINTSSLSPGSSLNPILKIDGSSPINNPSFVLTVN